MFDMCKYMDIPALHKLGKQQFAVPIPDTALQQLVVDSQHKVLLVNKLLWYSRIKPALR
jgi:hypothetical protein